VSHVIKSSAWRPKWQPGMRNPTRTFREIIAALSNHLPAITDVHLPEYHPHQQRPGTLSNVD